MEYLRFLYHWKTTKARIELYLRDRLRRYPHGKTAIWAHRQLLCDFCRYTKKDIDSLRRVHIECFLDQYHSIYLQAKDRRVLCDFIDYFDKR